MIAKPLAVYYEVVNRPYYVLIHSRIRAGHDRFDRYASKPSGLIEFMLAVIDHLTSGQIGVLDRMCELDESKKRDSTHRKRRYVSKVCEELVSPVEFKGYFFSTNADKTQAFAVIELACTAIEIPYKTVRHLPAPSDA